MLSSRLTKTPATQQFFLHHINPSERRLAEDQRQIFKQKTSYHKYPIRPQPTHAFLAFSDYGLAKNVALESSWHIRWCFCSQALHFICHLHVDFKCSPVGTIHFGYSTQYPTPWYCCWYLFRVISGAVDPSGCTYQYLLFTLLGFPEITVGSMGEVTAF